MRQHALIGALLVVGAGAQAAPLPLGEDDLKAAVAGKTVSIDTPFGMPLTVNYGANGIMTGTAGTALAMYLGAAKDRGRWHIRNGKLCQKWFKWLSGEPTCLSIQQDGLKIYWRSDEGRTGTAMIEPGPPVIEGATASGLGVPPKPEEPQTETAEHVAPPLPSPAPRHAHPPVRREVVQVKPVIHSIAFAPGVPPSRPPIAREAHSDQQQPAAMPPLVEPPREAMRPSPELPAEPSVARFAVAAFSPMRSILPSAAPIGLSRHERDPFEAGREPMRHAVEAVSMGVMEHRWCLANAFGQGPSLPPNLMVASAGHEREIDGAPVLLTIAQEQVYDGELPLHDAACLTKEPAIGLVAKLLGPES